MINPDEIANIAVAEEQLWWFRGMRQISFALLDGIVANGRLERAFEGGCGTGHFASLVAGRYGLRLYAVDLDAQAVSICHAKPGVQCVQASLMALPYRSAAFDLVLLMDVLAHFGEGEDLEALRETARLLRPGGHLLLRTSALKIFRSRHSEFVWERQRFSAGRLRSLAVKAGLTVQRLTYANSLLSPLALIKFRLWEPLTGKAPATGLVSLPKPVESIFYRALSVERALIASGINFPIGQSLYLVARRPA
jgi:SAM-dependent methyltransferase